LKSKYDALQDAFNKEINNLETKDLLANQEKAH